MAETDKSPRTLSWFPSGTLDLPGWRFDVITLLAIIGESAVQEHVQTITASSLCLLPRIIPAPQALLRPQRPQRLPEVAAKMVGVHSGVVLDTVGFFANIIHPLDELRPFEFKVLEILHKEIPESFARRGPEVPWWKRIWTKPKPPNGTQIETVDSVGPDAKGTTTTTPHGPDGSPGPDINGKETTVRIDLEQGHSTMATHLGAPRRTATMAERFTDALTKPTMLNSKERYSVPPTSYSPTHILSVISCLLTVGIIIAASYWKDGTAILAIAIISIASSVVCYASWWQPILMNRGTNAKVTEGDVVIRTREGAFILIRCTEEVARELYSGTVECRYISHKFHRLYMGLGMVLLMVAIVLLGNCGWNSQAFIGGSYILLNGLYWVMGLIPPKHFWDLTRYDVKDVTPNDAKNAHIQPQAPAGEGVPSFTRTLWYAVRETKHGAWVERSGAMPRTDEWKKWLNEAVEQSKNDNGQNWDAVGRKDDIMQSAARRRSPSSQTPVVDMAMQRAPLDEVQTGIFRRETMTQGTF
ncbi:hypothetical protein QBC42DRAFT_28828 [Cladorrhinum samala]|uniref:Uncharacterized protein n=1 Tax=Cladorrhinum samala TaxID=585594 RepID=A0AAV9HBL1_9PEZI|nr:hypothetical protein QBC42DRAFT_28828 [Cladorrhinum samala]